MADITSVASAANPWAAAAQGVSGLLSTGIGLLQRGSANRWLKKNQQPIENMPIEVKRNQQLAEMRANTGLPSEQYNNAMKNIQRQQLLSLRTAGQMGGGKALSILGGLNEQGNNAVGNLDAQDAQMRVNNEGKLMNVNNQVAGWKSNLFDKNVRQKWLREYDNKMSQQAAGNINATKGIDNILAAGGQYGASGGFNSNNSYGASGGGDGEIGNYSFLNNIKFPRKLI